MRCGELAETVRDLVTFCPEMMTVINCDSGDFNEALLEIKKPLTEMGSRIIVATPVTFQKMLKHLSGMACQRVFLDKVELMQALDFSSELEQIGEKLSKSIAIGTIVTTNVKDDKEQSDEERNDFK